MTLGDDRPRHTPQADAEGWLAAFEGALQSRDAAAAALFVDDGLWRDVLAFTWNIQTMAGRPTIEATLRQTLARTKPANFRIPPRRTPPRWVARAGTESIEAIFEFDTAFGPAHGILRLVPDSQGRLRAWTLNTNLHELRGHEEEFKRRAEPDSTRDFGAENWSDRLARQRAYADRDPAVLVVGGGQAGLSIAARLHQLGIDTLIVDRHQRIGDNWRKRYHSLTLHNEVFVNHMPYMPFPPTWPVYIPKDMLANWFEAYVDALELNFWTGTELTGGSYDDKRRHWNVTLRRSDGSERVMHPRHLILATGVSSIPYTPELPGLADFPGTKVHSGDFKNAEQWKGRKALVLGTGTSGHDVAQELHAHGADVTMIQRSRTYVVSLKEAQSVYAIYSEGIPCDDCDLLATSFPYPVLQRSYQLSTARGRLIPADLLVLATGYKNQQDTVRAYLGDEIADKIGPVWGFDDGGELRNMWRRTAQPGLWFTAGSLAQCRIFSRYLALQIKALEEGLLS